MHMKNRRICVGAGLITLDILVIENNYRNLSYYVGGSCGNVMMILAFLGWDVFPIARLGKNKNAERLISEFTLNNVNTKYVNMSDTGSTPMIIQKNTTDKYGNPKHRFELVDPVTGKFLPRFKSITLKIANDILDDDLIPSVFYFDRLSPGTLLLATEYKKRGALIVFEPSSIGNEKLFSKVLNVVDILKYSDQRISNYKEIYSDSNVPLEVETLGAEGINFRCNFIDKKWRKLSAIKIENVIDTAGAGDWTTSGIVYSVLTKFNRALIELEITDVEKAINFGQYLGASNCQHEGARGLMKLPKDNLLSYFGKE